MRLAPLLALLALCACLVRPPPPPLTGPGPSGASPRGPNGEPPIELTLKTWPDGAPWSLAQHRGSVVLLDVWATWCEPCKDSLPLYEDLLKQYGAKGLKVFAINVDADPREVELFVKAHNLTLPVLADPEARVTEVELKVKMMPTSVLVDRRGVVRHTFEGTDSDFVGKYVTALEALLAEPR